MMVAQQSAAASFGRQLSAVSRRTIAAIDLPNEHGYLSGWIVNSRALKHGSEMPENNVDAAVLHQLVSYLESLR